MDGRKEKVIIVGLGLIGGSIAKALRRSGKFELFGIDVNEDVLLDACSCGAIDKKAGENDLAAADVIYLCVYPQAGIDFVREHLGVFSSNAVITDTCGIKTYFCSEMEKLQRQRPFIFVGGHPMAGKEQSGFAASDSGLFYNASYLITPCAAPEEAVSKIARMAEIMGFSQIVKTTPEKHDRMIAFTSQLPHVLACAYVMSPVCPEHNGFSAGSYRDVSRVANINAGLWSGLFIENKEKLVEEIDILQKNIGLIKKAVETEDERGLFDLLSKAAKIKEADAK